MELIFQYLSKNLKNDDIMSIVSTIFISSSIFKTIHQRVVIEYVLKLSYFEFLNKYLKMDSPELHLIVTNYFKKIFKIY